MTTHDVHYVYLADGWLIGIGVYQLYQVSYFSETIAELTQLIVIIYSVCHKGATVYSLWFVPKRIYVFLV